MLIIPIFIYIAMTPKDEKDLYEPVRASNRFCGPFATDMNVITAAWPKNS